MNELKIQMKGKNEYGPPTKKKQGKRRKMK